jgi:hypothetical protein
MNRLLSGCMGCVAATVSGLTILSPDVPAGAGVLPLAAAMLSSAADAPVVAVQWKQWEYTHWPRQPWDWAWGAPLPQGRQSHVIYYAAAPYYYPGFQTTLGYNGHFGYPAAGTHRSYAPRRGPYPEAFD